MKALYDFFHWVPNLARAVMRFVGDHYGPDEDEDDEVEESD